MLKSGARRSCDYFANKLKVKMKQTNQAGFTLVELLVVVLIIGILAAIALPAYQRAVMRSRFVRMLPGAKSIAQGNEAYYMEHGQYSNDS